MPRKKKTPPSKVEMDGLTFTVPDDEVPLETHQGALIVFRRGRFGARFEGAREGGGERKWYGTPGRIKAWVDKQVEAQGGHEKLDPDRERLTIAVIVDGNGRSEQTVWAFGRLLRHRVSQYARMLYQLDGDEEVREDTWYSSHDVRICDDPAFVEELNEAEEAVREAIDHRDKLKDRYLRKFTWRDSRSAVVKEAKKQIARMRAKARRRAA